MAIIDNKRLEADEEAERNARIEAEEYASRNDRAWHQPPPAYEEAAGGPSGSSSVAQQRSTPNYQSTSTDESPIPDQPDNPATAQQSQPRSNDEESDDESMPLLTRRQKIKLKQKLRGRTRYRRFWHFLFAFLLGAFVLSLVMNLLGKSADTKKDMPEPWWDDGKPVRDPEWSPVKDTPQESWPSPNIPQYTSRALFSIAANESLAFVRAHGSSYNGVIITLPASSIDKEEWQEFDIRPMIDRIGVLVEAKFSHRSLLNKVRINTMIDERDGERKEGVSVNGENKHLSPDENLTLNFYVFLPDSTYRTAPQGLARDGTSWIRNLELMSDNTRVAVEGYDGLNDDVPGTMGWTFGKLAVYARTGGITIGMAIRANESISMHIDTGQIRDIYFREPTLVALAAPKVDVTTANGPIWISGAVGIDHLNLKSVTGGLNISHIAVAEKVSCSSSVGVLGGRWSAYRSISAHTTADLQIDVDANKDTYFDYVKSSGLLQILNPEKTAGILAMSSNESSWRPLKVDAFTQTGRIVLDYRDQDKKTLLMSNATTVTGSIMVRHSSGFEGRYDIRTTVGSIKINQPNAGKPESGKHFTVDLDVDKGKIGRLMKGRSWFKNHDWKDGGTDGSSLFPISHSVMTTEVGSIRADFA
ncbi:uncharacterized protein FA14DRAFT_161446 [Meira miltonrushii]|uniref:Adhesin domain-containing protein n=1 Tax=Meira miltonrushii TaxID=1280837 RepID=A0A316V8D2_9BASI|nr:uncharacterized protein FA14DRAFT_161446 [Meira miltonrushii]PWN33756.1 hypothetical protein FA14DRAFT_161446 [Meira miltonrushii]